MGAAGNVAPDGVIWGESRRNPWENRVGEVPQITDLSRVSKQ